MKEEWAARAIASGPRTWVRKRNAAPLETNKVPKQRAQIITKEIKTKKLKTYN